MPITSFSITHARASDYRGTESMTARNVVSRILSFLTGCAGGTLGATALEVGTAAASGTVTLSSASGAIAVYVGGASAEADDVWSALLGAFDDGGSDRPRLLLNDANPTVRRILVLRDTALRQVAAESLYGRALLAGGRRLRPVDTALIDRSFNALLDRAVDEPGGTLA